MSVASHPIRAGLPESESSVRTWADTGRPSLLLDRRCEPKTALTNIIARKAAFNALPIDGIRALVKQDLANLSASTTKFEAALIAAASADLVAEATAFKGRVDGYFAAAIAAYAQGDLLVPGTTRHVNGSRLAVTFDQACTSSQHFHDHYHLRS
ncbi:hypothetical protein H0H81_001275 [Sphagnurus paluster]|uniref:Uncharacterized protein n=1 Tax=Sphagnurus paluster TaxID=117069 RepID=A0A9P7K1R8_9AGAR|nr:hypothetical protein H0H81_001275 [Sphagnurus paluster]